ncbi:hypothetical protein Forpi1262_v016773 [Fusarium oxysporum f. sp. raphani]|uniref:Uncharacterized protein n=2 Tax=Fusarium oxysporum TaxID=5507 RepID=A0A420M592_FUSOX|nr:hypothetical protein Forpi1262_v016773 [Fusarium oxysporum f. sp. raphani]RKK40206.1 hypothetical protein BFJ69_g18494 [Fusarium oxysporum]
MGLTSVAAYDGLLRKTLSAQMKSIYGLVARLLQATGKVLNRQHDEEELPNTVLVESSTTTSIERITRYEEAHIGVETVVATKQTLWAISLRLLYVEGRWAVSKKEITAVF